MLRRATRRGPCLGAALHREDDRAEPGAGHAADRALHGQQSGPGDSLSASAFRRTLHAGQHRVAGFGRRGARDAGRPGYAAHSGALA